MTLSTTARTLLAFALTVGIALPGLAAEELSFRQNVGGARRARPPRGGDDEIPIYETTVSLGRWPDFRSGSIEATVLWAMTPGNYRPIDDRDRDLYLTP